MGLNFLLAAELRDITQVLALVEGPGNKNERPFLSDECYELLVRNFATFGYADGVKLQEDLRDRPIQTLLNLILYFNSRT